MKAESSNSQNEDNLLAKEKVFGKSNYRSKSFNKNKANGVIRISPKIMSKTRNVITV